MRGGWMALAFLLPYSAVVYACVCKCLPKGVVQHCDHCGAALAAKQVECPACGSGKLLPETGISPEKAQKKTRRCLLAAAITWALSSVAVTACFLLMMAGSFAMLDMVPNDLFGDYLPNDYSYFSQNETGGDYGTISFYEGEDTTVAAEEPTTAPPESTTNSSNSSGNNSSSGGSQYYYYDDSDDYDYDYDDDYYYYYDDWDDDDWDDDDDWYYYDDDDDWYYDDDDWDDDDWDYYYDDDDWDSWDDDWDDWD